MRLLSAVILLGISSCSNSDPLTPSDDFVASEIAIDTVLAFTQNGELITCNSEFPSCDQPRNLTCGPIALAGPPDGDSFPLEAGGRLEVGILCGAILEQGGIGSRDFTITSTVPAGSSAVVEVSFDGIVFHTLTSLDTSNQSFDLAFATDALDVVRYVRISDSGSGGIAIDAIQPTPTPQN